MNDLFFEPDEECPELDGSKEKMQPWVFDSSLDKEYLDSREIVERGEWLFLIEKFTEGKTNNVITMVWFSSPDDPSQHIQREKRREIAKQIFEGQTGICPNKTMGDGVSGTGTNPAWKRNLGS